MDNEQQFRTAAFGGFQKQDVINYLERSAREHGEQLTALQRSLTEAQEARETLEQQLDTYKGTLAETQEQGEQLTQALTEKDEALAQVRRRAEELEAQVTALKAEVARLTPDAQAYASLKSRAAGIELEAHARAQAIETEGQHKLQKIQKDLLAWFEGMQGTYTKLRRNMEATLSSAAQDLQQAGRSVEGSASELCAPDAALQAVREQIETLAPQAPQPLTTGVPTCPQPLATEEPIRPKSMAEPTPLTTESQGPVPFTREGEQ